MTVKCAQYFTSDIFDDQLLKSQLIFYYYSSSSSSSCFIVACIDLSGHLLPDHLLQLQCLHRISVLQLQVGPVYVPENLRKQDIQVVGPVFDQFCVFFVVF